MPGVVEFFKVKGRGRPRNAWRNSQVPTGAKVGSSWSVDAEAAGP